MKNKRSRTTVDQSVFRDKVFVISNTYKGKHRKTIQGLIESNGGRIKLHFPSDFLVQSFLDDDDDRLGEAHDCGALVVSPHYVQHCINEGTMVNFREYALARDFTIELQRKKSNEDEDGDGNGSDDGENDDESVSTIELSNSEKLILDKIAGAFEDIREESREYEEQPQTFYDFVHMERYEPTEERNVMYIVKIDSRAISSSRPVKQRKYYRPAIDDTVPSIETILEFCQCYFSSAKLQVKVLNNELLIEDLKSRSKTVNLRFANNHEFAYPVHIRRLQSMDGVIRLNALEVLDVLQENLPKDAFCVLAITDEDLYECEDDDTVIMGRATGDRVGIVSLFRFNPLFDQHHSRKVHTKRQRVQWLSRALKTVAHESMHMMGIDHCSFYCCVMNACVENGEQDEREPIFLCPIDLRKLLTSVGFDLLGRYERMLRFFEKHQMVNEADWIKKNVLSKDENNK